MLPLTRGYALHEDGSSTNLLIEGKTTASAAADWKSWSRRSQGLTLNSRTTKHQTRTPNPLPL
jgi:hypothetical protein